MVIQVEAVLPERDVFRPKSEPARIAEACHDQPRAACASLDALLAHFTGDGRRLLLQGRLMQRFPDGRVRIADRVTFVGRESMPGHVTVLVTAPDGVSRTAVDE